MQSRKIYKFASHINSIMAPSVIETVTEVESETKQTKDVPTHWSSKSQSSYTSKPLELRGVLDKYESFNVTPVIGKEFTYAKVVDWLHAPNSDELLRDLAITSK